jgi:dTDP-glucose 4,6-dehydratase
MRLLVTGGAGFIGSAFVRRALDADPDVKVTVLDRLTYAANLGNLHPVAGRFDFVRGDICDPALVAALLPGHDAVVNFAAETHVDRSIAGAAEFARTNVVGTQTLLEAAVTAGVERFVQISTDEVYGDIPEGSWTEAEPVAPNSPYSATKAAADLLVLAYGRTHGLHVNITRCSNNYGPYQFPEKVIPYFLTRLMRGRKVPLYGDGLNVRDWLHVDDHCRGIRIVLERGEPGEIYNIGAGTELTNRDLTARLLHACSATWDAVEYVADRKGHDRRYSVDCSKLAALGYRPQVPFDEGLTATIRWYRENRWWWAPLLTAERSGVGA